MPTVAYLIAELVKWPPKTEMAALLNAAGLRVTEGRYSLRLDDCSHFLFQEYGGDLGNPIISADAESVSRMLSDAERVSNALSRARVSHRFEVYDDKEALVGFFHYAWPLSGG